MRASSDNTAQNLAPINAAFDLNQTRLFAASYIGLVTRRTHGWEYHW